MAHVELVGSEYNPQAKADKDTAEDAPKKAKGVGERLKRAARGLNMSLKTFAFYEAVKSKQFTQEEIDAWLKTKGYQKTKRSAPAREHAGLNWKRFGRKKGKGGSSGDGDKGGKKGKGGK